MAKLGKELQKKVANADRDPFAPLDEGFHKVRLVEVDFTESKKGDPMAVWKFKSVDPQPDKELREYTVLTDAAIWKVAQIFDAFGVKPDVDTDDLVGKTIIVEVGQEVQSEGKGKGRLRHFIAGYPDQKGLKPRLFKDDTATDEATDTETGDADDPDF